MTEETWWKKNSAALIVGLAVALFGAVVALLFGFVPRFFPERPKVEYSTESLVLIDEPGASTAAYRIIFRNKGTKEEEHFKVDIDLNGSDTKLLSYSVSEGMNAVITPGHVLSLTLQTEALQPDGEFTLTLLDEGGPASNLKPKIHVYGNGPLAQQVKPQSQNTQSLLSLTLNFIAILLIVVVVTRITIYRAIKSLHETEKSIDEELRKRDKNGALILSSALEQKKLSADQLSK